jgi:hypothetical protein
VDPRTKIDVDIEGAGMLLCGVEKSIMSILPYTLTVYEGFFDVW